MGMWESIESETNEERRGGPRGSSQRVSKERKVTKMVGLYREGQLGEGQPRIWTGKV